MTEKMITIAKVNDLHHKRMAMAFITKEGVTKKLFDEIAPKYAEKTAVTPESLSWDPAAVTPQKWQSSSCCNLRPLL